MCVSMCMCVVAMPLQASSQVKPVKLMTNVFEEQRTADRERDKEKVSVCKRGRERILHGTPTEKRNISRSFILFERLGGLWQGPIMIGYVYEAAGVHHLKFDSLSTTKRGFMHFKAFKCHDDFWGKVTRARATIIIIRRKQVSLVSPNFKLYASIHLKSTL